MRAINYSYPAGYGYFSTEGTADPHWTGNLHFINTLDLSTQHFQDQPDPAGAATKACVECNWSPGNTGIACIKGSMGNFGCCVDGGRCLTNNMANKTKTTYYLKYDIWWTTDMTQVKPVQYGVVDTFACASLGNIAPNMKTKTHTCDDKICVGEIERTMDKDATILWSYIHQHVSAINGTLYHNGQRVCTSAPGYGTDRSNPIGNEAGFINKWDVCIDADGRQNAEVRTLPVKKGDKLKWRSLYNVESVDKRILPMPGGAHGGVMGLGYFLMHPTNSYKCINGQCVGVTNGVDIDTCTSACG